MRVIKYIRQDRTLQDMWNALYALEDEMEEKNGLDAMRRLDIQAGFEAGQRVVADAPVAEVTEVVRCKDCRLVGEEGKCMWHRIFPPSPDWFCADGERRRKEDAST